MNRTTARSNSLRGFACAMAMGACMMFHSAMSHAAAFQVAFDPWTELYGVATFDVSDACLASDGMFNLYPDGNLVPLLLNGCTISMVSAHISTDGAHGTYHDYIASYYLPFYPYVLFSELAVSGNQLAGLTTLFPIQLLEVGSLDAFFLSSVGEFGIRTVDNCGPTISFTVTGHVEFSACVDGVRQTLPGDVTSITRIPEPATLGLVVGAAFAGWLTRRRKRAA